MPPLVQPVIAPGTLAAMPQPTIAVDAGLLLRPWEPTDARSLVEAYQDPDIQLWHLRTIDTEAEAREWMAFWAVTWQAERHACWAVADAASGALVGRVGLRELNLSEGSGECSYWVAAHARTGGVATRATAAVMAWAFDVGFHRLELRHAVENLASCRVADKLGFALEGTLRSQLLHLDGWHDMHLHALVRPAAPPS